METTNKLSIEELMEELPANYQDECKKQGAVKRWRGVKNAADLMLLILIHLVNGTSLLEISTIAKMRGIGDFSDVAFMKQLAKCTDWFNCISRQLLDKAIANYKKPLWLKDYIVVAADATDVVEKGRTKRTFRLHYLLDIFNMSCADFKITTQKIGEKLCNFGIKPHMLVIADPIYSTINSMSHCLENRADFILRLRKNGFRILDENGKKLNLTNILRNFNDHQVAEISGFFRDKAGNPVPVRICAKRKTQEQIEKTWKRMKHKESSNNFTYSADAKLMNEYIIVVTSLPQNITAEQIMETYRLRWQIEICFKSFKSLLDFGELPKKTAASTMAWLNGKLMSALLVESVMARSFSP
jgi:hypothetical protein